MRVRGRTERGDLGAGRRPRAQRLHGPRDSGPDRVRAHGGRVYDPRLGRFLSPDPIVSEPLSGQGWDPYSYVGNSPLSRTDPTGYCYAAGPLCQVAGGGGFTNVTQTLTSWSMSWIPVYATITRGRVSFGIGRSFWNGEDGGFFGRGGFFRPRVSFRIGLPFPVFTSMARMVSLGQESSPADLRIVGAVGAGGKLEEALRTTRVY